MPTITQLIRNHLTKDVHERMPPPSKLAKSERDPTFERLRNNRKVLGAMRYGRIGSVDKPQYNRVGCMIRRLEQYIKDKNAEHLVDVANLAELEFVEGDHDGVLLVDDGEHTEAI